MFFFFEEKEYYGQTVHINYNEKGAIISEKEYDICSLHLDASDKYKKNHLLAFVDYDNNGDGYYKKYAEVKDKRKQIILGKNIIMELEGPMKNYKRDGSWYSYFDDETLHAKIDYQNGNIVKAQCGNGREWTPIEMRKWANGEMVTCKK